MTMWVTPGEKEGGWSHKQFKDKLDCFVVKNNLVSNNNNVNRSEQPFSLVDSLLFHELLIYHAGQGRNSARDKDIPHCMAVISSVVAKAETKQIKLTAILWICSKIYSRSKYS